jgi:MarR family transcriptional regulator, organic hydroperoxide resistance regulator
MTTFDGPVVREIAALLRELVHALSEPTIKAWTELDFTLPQLKTLKVLSHEGSSSIGHIAERLGVGQPTASHLVERLVQAGLVERAEDPANRRRTLARLSSSGEELIGQLRGTRGEQLFVWLNELDSTDLHALRQGLLALMRVARGHLAASLADGTIV